MRDPWRDATVSSDFHMRQSTAEQPIAIGDGFHCSDLSTANAQVDATVAKVQAEALANMKTWLAEWTPSTSNAKRDAPDTVGSPVAKPISAWMRKTPVIA